MSNKRSTKREVRCIFWGELEWKLKRHDVQERDWVEEKSSSKGGLACIPRRGAHIQRPLRDSPYSTDFRTCRTGINSWPYNKEKGTEIEAGCTDFEVSIAGKSVQGPYCTCSKSGHRNWGHTAVFSVVLDYTGSYRHQKRDSKLDTQIEVLGRFVR